MVIELFVGSLGDRYVAWTPLFPGVICFSEWRDRAVELLRRGCAGILVLKRQGGALLPDPSLIDWVTRSAAPPEHFQGAYQNALDSIRVSPTLTEPSPMVAASA